MICSVVTQRNTTIQWHVANADHTWDAVQALQRMSSSLKDVTIKAFRRSKDAEVPNNIEEQQTAAPVKKKTGAKVKKMAARFVPAALGKLSHPWMLSCAPCDVPPPPQLRTVRVFRELRVNCHAIHAEVSAAMQSSISLLYRL